MMLKLKNSVWTLGALVAISVMTTSCDKILSMIKEEFNSERVPPLAQHSSEEPEEEPEDQ